MAETDRRHPDAAITLDEAGHCGTGQAWRAGRVLVLSVEGDAGAIGYQHGALARDAAHSGALDHLATATRQLDGIRDLPLAKRALAHAYVSWLYRVAEKGLAQEYREEIAGLAKGLGSSRRKVVRSSFLSEVLQQLAAASFKTQADALTKGGCTAAAVIGREPGMVIHGKNQDYDAAGHWDNSPALIITRLKGAHAYAKATSAGLLKGNLSINECGLSIGGHMLFSNRSGRKGHLFTTLENDVMRRASSLDQALDLLRQSPRCGCYAFVVTDASERRAVVVECDDDRVSVRDADQNTLGMSNIFTTDVDAETRDMLIAGGFDRNPRSRQNRINELLLAQTAALSVQDVGIMLADRFDPASGVDRALAHTIANIMTVTSAIVRPGQHEMWISDSPAPTSLGRFIGFDLAGAFAGKAPVIIGSFTTIVDGDAKARAIRLYIAARRAFEEKRDADKALLLLEQSIQADPAEPAFYRFAARLHLRKLDLNRARGCLDTMPATRAANELAEQKLLLGHVADLLGNRETAISHYMAIIGLGAATCANRLHRIAPPLIASARRYSRKAISRQEAISLPVPFSLISGIE
jgi:Acyl-coenzyme A:6-aminopenicillanic acid acyl-transferase